MNRDGNAPCVPASKVKCILIDNLEFDGLLYVHDVEVPNLI